MIDQYFAQAELTTYSAPFPRMGDKGVFGFQLTDRGGDGELDITLQHRNSEDTSFTDVGGGSVDLNLSSHGFYAFLAPDYTKEILRFKFVTSSATAEMTDWVNWQFEGYSPYDDQT